MEFVINIEFEKDDIGRVTAVRFDNSIFEMSDDDDVVALLARFAEKAIAEEKKRSTFSERVPQKVERVH